MRGFFISIFLSIKYTKDVLLYQTIMFLNKKGFTIIEIMTVVFIIGLLAAAVYIGTMPYYQRSRDTGRLTQVQSYASVFTTYKQSADSFPSTFWSWGNSVVEGKCITEIFSRNDGTTPDTKFTVLSKGISNPPLDPKWGSAIPIPPCPINGSYFYDRLINASGEQVAVVATRLEAMGSANLATGSYLVMDTQADYLYSNTKRWTVPPGSSDSIFFMALK